MPPRVLSAIVAAIAYAVTLTIAAILLGGMSISFWAGILPVALFTVLIVFLRPLIVKLTENVSLDPHLLTLIVGVLTVWVSLLICDAVFPANIFRIEGFWTWVWAVLIVTVGTLIYDIVDDRLIAMAKPTADKVAAEVSAMRGK